MRLGAIWNLREWFEVLIVGYFGVGTNSLAFSVTNANSKVGKKKIPTLKAFQFPLEQRREDSSEKASRNYPRSDAHGDITVGNPLREINRIAKTDGYTNRKPTSLLRNSLVPSGES